MAGVGDVEVAMRLATGDGATAAATAVVCRGEDGLADGRRCGDTGSMRRSAAE